jgi:hypothetical protein
MVLIIPHQPGPTPEAEALSTKIAELVRLCREENSAIRSEDVRVAMRLASGRLSGGGSAQLTSALLLLLGVFVAGLVVYFNNFAGSPPNIAMVIGGLIAVLAVVAAIAKRRLG